MGLYSLLLINVSVDFECEEPNHTVQTSRLLQIQDAYYASHLLSLIEDCPLVYCPERFMLKSDE